MCDTTSTRDALAADRMARRTWPRCPVLERKRKSERAREREGWAHLAAVPSVGEGDFARFRPDDTTWSGRFGGKRSELFSGAREVESCHEEAVAEPDVGAVLYEDGADLGPAVASSLSC